MRPNQRFYGKTGHGEQETEPRTAVSMQRVHSAHLVKMVTTIATRRGFQMPCVCRDSETMWSEEHNADLPATILACSAVARTIEFSSKQAIEDLRLEQRMLLHDHEVERELARAGVPACWLHVVHCGSQISPMRHTVVCRV
jgi:hypothetical protein